MSMNHENKTFGQVLWNKTMNDIRANTYTL